MLHIDHLLDRKTADLSGGEMQRVSIGRAIVRRPRVFLMDGSLSNLDAKLRESLRVELKHLQKTRGVTTLFVTHDQIEALTMADRLAVLSEGRIIQVGIPEDIHDRPATTYVAQLVGTPRINLVKAARSNGRLRLRRGAVGFAAPSTFDLPEEFLLDGEHRGEIILTEPLGVETIVHLRTGDEVLLSILWGFSHLSIGEEVAFTVGDECLQFFRRKPDCPGGLVRAGVNTWVWFLAATERLAVVPKLGWVWC